MSEIGRTAHVVDASWALQDLASRRFLIVSGKGGVGRTTIAALVGMGLADMGRKVLVATTGHDDRLAWMLGAGRLSDQPSLVHERLYVQRLVPQTCIREYGALVLRSGRLSTAVFDNRVVAPLLRAIPGLDDFALVGKAWHEALRGGQFDTVIFDGPATGHLLYTLGVPRAILESIAPGPLTREAELMQRHFEDPSLTSAVLVGLPESWPLTELGELGGALREQVGIHTGAVVVNGLWPADLGALAAVATDDSGVDPVEVILRRARQVAATGRRQLDQVTAWRSEDAARRCGARSVVLTPWQFGGIPGPQILRNLAQGPIGG